VIDNYLLDLTLIFTNLFKVDIVLLNYDEITPVFHPHDVSRSVWRSFKIWRATRAFAGGHSLQPTDSC